MGLVVEVAAVSLHCCSTFSMHPEILIYGDEGWRPVLMEEAGKRAACAASQCEKED